MSSKSQINFSHPLYIEQIRARKKDFVFFFYRKKNDVVYPIHNLLPCCGKFIGYNPECDFFVKGKIAAPENVASIQIAAKAELLKWLEQSGYENATKGKAEQYYTMKITGVEMVAAVADGMKKLKAAIDNFEGNDVLGEHSPKVLGDFQV